MVVVTVATMVEVDLGELGEVVGVEVVVVIADGYPVEVGVVVVGNLGEEGDGEVAVIVEAEVVLAADQALREDSGEGDDAATEDVAIVIIVVVEAEATLVDDEALREDDIDSDDTPPSLKMILIVAGRERHTAHGQCTSAESHRH